MKLYTWFTFALVLLFSFSCQQVKNPSKEKEAILAVLEEESAAVLAGDFERYRNMHVQDDLETRIEMGIHNYHVYKGWNKIEPVMRDFIEGGMNDDAVNRKENLIMDVNGKSAWLTCDNIWQTKSSPQEVLYNNIQIVFLERIRGEWKISFAAYYTKGELE